MNYKSVFKKYTKLKKIGISFLEVMNLYKARNSVKAKDAFIQTMLFNKKIWVDDIFWYLVILEELFIDEMYKFNSTNKTPYIIDCGANIGLSVIYFKRLFPEADIIAFEPDTAIFNTLEKNLLSFGYNTVEIVNKAVWVDTTPISFLASGGVGGRIVDTVEENAGEIVQLPTFRLYDLLHKPVDFLKIDIEGAEHAVLMDCANMLHNVKNIFIEYHSILKDEQKLDEILKVLTNAGFKYYIKEAWNNQPHPYVNKREGLFDLQLCIFGYRVES